MTAFFPDAVWIFRLPAIALIGGVAFINFFIVNTNKKLEAARRVREQQAAKKTA